MSKPLTHDELPEDVIRSAEAQVAAGRFASIADVFRAGLDAVAEREDAEQEWVEYARDTWRARIAASERGEYTEGSPAAIMAAIRARVERAV